MASSSTNKFKYVCVIAGNNMGNDTGFRLAAVDLGNALAANGINVVYGGGCKGIMGRTIDLAYLGEAKVLGVIPSPIAEKYVNGPTIGDELRVSNVQDCAITIVANVDAFVIFPGGLGTLEGIFHFISWARLNIHQKPIGIVNVGGFYDMLITFLDSVVEKGFMTPQHRRLFICETTTDELHRKLSAFAAEPDPTVAHLVWTGTTNTQKRKLDVTITL